MSRANCGVASSQLIRTLFFSFDQERELRLELKEATSEAEQVSILFGLFLGQHVSLRLIQTKPTASVS